MLPRYHFLFGIVACLIMYFGFSISAVGCFVFLVATIGIDVDHYLYYIWKKKDWSLGRAVGWFGKSRDILRKIRKEYRGKIYAGFYFFHGVEFLILILLAGYFVWNLFYFVGLGILFHLILDHVDQLIWGARFDRFFVIYDYFKYKKLDFIEDVGSLKKKLR